MANIADFLLWAIWPTPRLFKDSETPAWLELSSEGFWEKRDLWASKLGLAKKFLLVEMGLQ